MCPRFASASGAKPPLQANGRASAFALDAKARALGRVVHRLNRFLQAAVGKVSCSKSAGGAGFYRGLGLERLLRDARGVQFHLLPETRRPQFSGRLALGHDPIGEGVAGALQAAA